MSRNLRSASLARSPYLVIREQSSQPLGLRKFPDRDSATVWCQNDFLNSGEKKVNDSVSSDVSDKVSYKLIPLRENYLSKQTLRSCKPQERLITEEVDPQLLISKT
jgi:hypothetical protein